MGLDLTFLCARFPALQPSPIGREPGVTSYQLQLPHLPQDRAFKWAELRVPKGFPELESAFIQLSPDAVLNVPHLDGAGVLCVKGDPGPGSGCSAEERILFLLHAYLEKFLKPWMNGDLDGDFEAEALNYWAIEVARARSEKNPVRAVWTVDHPPVKARLRSGLLLIPSRILIAADEQLRITNRVVQSMGPAATQRVKVLIADIPISHVFTPTTWPRTTSDLERILKGRLPGTDFLRFQSSHSRRGRGIYRIALLRSLDVAFAYLLPGGPPTVLNLKRGKKTFPPLRKPLPLMVSRIDPGWTVGRDQHPEVQARQGKHILVLGAGALGSPSIDHLAKAGVGRISVVDSDTMSSANIGRHLLGADSVGKTKVDAIAQRVNSGYPATLVIPHAMTTAEWLKKNSLADVDAVLDLTGEPDVRAQLELARLSHPCPLLIGWMEPYVAAAHVCVLPSDKRWLQGAQDPMSGLEAVVWPSEVIRQEPGCSSRFQSYTAAAAAHAVALVAECALEMIDCASDSFEPTVRSWVRGQNFLDKHWPGLVHKDWALSAREHDGLTLIRQFP
ncbi:ThiF family adenylyltransferase [Pseudomonas aeruginosa]|uniref:HesA/MoeB/ThiF family protein n=1 Tax=Pseudomonas aeruginosa TaxID=287 RepID=UPI0024AF85B1|nr:ThiF family adenylyltransferase [Pseudomonas aeruginosa]MDI7134216.1 ThiF family adenylyltransferase [Pseudomonas aeruginosa]